jgi:hypothetical protein
VSLLVTGAPGATNLRRAATLTGVGVVLVLAAVGLLAGMLTGGRLRRLGAVPVRRPVLLLGALVAQGVGALLTVRWDSAYVTGLALSGLLATGFVVVNRRVAGVPLVGVGLVLNAVVIGANGAMPVSLAAAERVGLSEERLALDGDPRHEAVDANTRLGPFGDVIGVPLPWGAEIVSAGDVLVAAGAGWFLFAGVRGRRPTGQTPRRRDRLTTLDSDSTTRGS